MQSEDVVMEDELEYESDVEADLEVDELDSSGSDQENAAQPSASTASKKANTAKQGARVPGHTLLPQVRIENILQADVLNPGISGNLALSKEGQFILSVATEEFIKKLAKAGLGRAQADRRSKMVNYEDMAGAARRQRPFAFLKPTIPEPLPLHAAWELRGIRHMELMEEDPALGGVIPPGSFGEPSRPPSPEPEPTPPIASTSTATGSKKNAKAAAKNGVEPHTNGHAANSSTSNSSSRRAPSNENPQIASISTAVQSQSKSSSSSSRGGSKKNNNNGGGALVPPMLNGNGNGKAHSTVSASGSGVSTPTEGEVMKVEDLRVDDDEDDEMTGESSSQPKTQHSIGPVSGFKFKLQGLHAPTGSNISGTLQGGEGRTIYSQKNRPD